MSHPDTRVSKTLAWLLRHNAVAEGFQFIDGCYLNLDDILAHRKFRGVTAEDVERIVSQDPKKRYELRRAPDSGRAQIRAVQGHSLKVDGLDLTEITADTCGDFPVVIHGTYNRNWSSIAAQGLSRMARTHIHFAAGEIGADGVISGLRRSADVLVYLDLPRAIAGGFKFFVSRNNVVLCEGDEAGYLPATYFKEVWKLKPYRLLIFADGRPN